MKILSLFFVSFLLWGCAAALVPQSNDPSTKLSQAQELLSLNRPIPAERLIREAIDAFSLANDKKGLANAYAQYGLMLNSTAYRSYEKFWRDSGKYDPTPKTTIDYLEKSLALFTEASDPEGQRFSTFQLGRLYGESGDNVKACRAYDLSNRYHQDARQKFPTHNFYLAQGYSTWEEMVAALKRPLGCTS